MIRWSVGTVRASWASLEVTATQCEARWQSQKVVQERFQLAVGHNLHLVQCAELRQTVIVNQRDPFLIVLGAEVGLTMQVKIDILVARLESLQRAYQFDPKIPPPPPGCDQRIS